MNLKRIAVGLLACCCLSASVLAQIQPGRAIQITISGVPPEEKGRFDPIYPVSESGMINMPLIGLVKAAVFGFIIATMGAYQGYNSQGGALGVGRATTNAVVGSIVLILAVNYLITAFFVE